MPPFQDPSRAWYLDTAPLTATRWIVSLQMARVVVSGLTLVAAILLPATEVPLHRIAPLLAGSLLLQLDIAWRLRQGRQAPALITAASLAADVALLTGLLELSGGPSNPFAVVYAIQVAVAWAMLGATWAIGLAAWAAACLGVLIYWHLGELVAAHHRLEDLPTHLFTMWLALSTMAAGIGHFIRESTLALSKQEKALDDMRAQAARTDRVMALTTLAAGAAHELSTPLATVAVASRELELALAAAGANPEWRDDAQLIREQVERCHAILDQLSGRATGPVVADTLTSVESVFDDLRQRLAPEQAARVEWVVSEPEIPLGVSRTGLVQVLLSLVKNAFDASEPTQPVVLEGRRGEAGIQLIVRDHGPGMSAAVLGRAGEPFFTTKAAGRGMGLGLFLARIFAERSGGTLTLRSDRGTIAVLELPIAREPAALA